MNESRMATCHPDKPARTRGLCATCAHREWYLKNREKRLEQTRAYNDAWRKTEAGRKIQRNARYKIKYGITIEDYDRMFEEQSGLCAICGNPPEEGQLLNVDHDHETGKVRALLCFTCNNGLGSFQDDPELLKKASQYLEEFNE